jgi:hypothetical protein
VGRTAAPFHEWVAAVAPTGRLLEMATLLEKAVSNELTTLALGLNEYQYNGPDPRAKRQDTRRRNSHTPHSHTHKAKSNNTRRFSSGMMAKGYVARL